MSSYRDRVMTELKRRVGFPFSETELSPDLRKRIGEMEPFLLQYDNKKQERDAAQSKKGDTWITFYVLVAIGGLLLLTSILSYLLVTVAVPLLFVAYYFYTEIKKQTGAIQRLDEEVKQVQANTGDRLDNLSRDIFSELSQRHSVHSSPQTTIQKQIERETVKIRCPYCRTINPDTRTTCSHCGARL